MRGNRRSKSNFSGNNRRRPAGKAQVYRKANQIQTPSATTKRGDRTRLHRNDEFKPTGTQKARTANSGNGNVKSSQPEDRVAAFFYQKKTSQSDENVLNPSDARNTLNWVRKEGDGRSDKATIDPKTSFSSIVKNREKCQPSENQSKSPLQPNINVANTNQRQKTSSSDERGRSAQPVQTVQPFTTRHKNEQRSRSPKVQRVQRRPPMSSRRMNSSNRGRSPNRGKMFSSPHVPPEAISKAVSDHHDHLRSQIGDLVKQLSERNQETEELRSQLNVRNAEITRLGAEKSQEKRVFLEEKREISNAYIGMAQRLQSLGVDPESIENMGNTQANRDRVLFLRERMLKSEEEWILFQKHQEELLEHINEERSVLQQFAIGLKKRGCI